MVVVALLTKWWRRRGDNVSGAEVRKYSCANASTVMVSLSGEVELGSSLAQDVAEHFYREGGVVYSRKKDNHKLVPVELPHDYNQLSQLLKSRDRTSRPTTRPAPIIEYEPAYPTTARRTAPPPAEDYREERTKVTIEPASSARNRKPSATKSKHKSKRYSTVVIEDDVEAGPSTLRVQDPERKERRGSLYYEDMQRQRKEAYRVEVREPEGRESRRRERPKSEYWI